jgi:hypothetical protein
LFGIKKLRVQIHEVGFFLALMRRLLVVECKPKFAARVRDIVPNFRLNLFRVRAI